MGRGGVEKGGWKGVEEREGEWKGGGEGGGVKGGGKGVEGGGVEKVRLDRKGQ